MGQSYANGQYGHSATETPNGQCRINFDLRPKINVSETLNAFDLNLIMVDVDQVSHPMRWGKATLEVAPGLHRIEIWLKNPLLKSPKASVDVNLQPGETLSLRFTGPATVFSAGTMDFTLETSVAPPERVQETSTCSACGQPMPADGRFCPHCGTQVQPKLVCSKCGGTQPSGKFCVHCGSSLG